MLTGKVSTGLLLVLLVVHWPVTAQVYKWTDEDGNVHYGDKPMDADAAASAETVEINQDYTPPQRSAQEMEAIQSQERARSEADRRRREAQEKQVAQERAARSEAKLARCRALDADIETFGTSRMINGILHVTYIEGEDGKSISAAEQRAIVEQMKREREELGCPGT